MNLEELVVRHERRLFRLAYAVLGSRTEAEDAVQEAFLRLSTASDVDVPEAWLHTVVTRLALDRLRSAQRRREQYVGPWLPEPLVVDDADPADEAALAESLSMAFLVVLESLGPQERVVFLLHDVFGHPFEQVGAMVGITAAAARQSASRARRRLQDRPHRFEADRTARDAITGAFLAACAGGDVQELVELLAPDVALLADGGGVVSAARRPVVGPLAVARFLLGLVDKAGPGLRTRRVLVNGGPGLLVDSSSTGRAVMALDVVDGKVAVVSVVRNPQKLAAVRTWPDVPGS